jgi:hypothetical protein
VGCVVGGIFVIAMLVLFAARGVPAAIRAQRGARAARDRPAWLVGLVVRGLPRNRAEWGRAMQAELTHLQGPRNRWSFGLGCAIAATRMRARAALTDGERGGRALRAATLGGAAVALALVVYGLHRYPGLAAGPAAWAAIIAFLLVLCAYACGALTLARGRTPAMARARRSGLLGGLVIGAAWLVVLAPSDRVKTLVALPLVVALLGPAVLAGIVGRTTRSARVATHEAAWSGIVGGLLVFVVWVVAAYRGAGGPYDPQLLRDFHQSGAHDLATYAVGDDLGAGLSMLVLVPTVAYALGSLSARVGAGAWGPQRPSSARRPSTTSSR